MAFVQKKKAENRDQIKADGKPIDPKEEKHEDETSSRGKLVVHREAGGGFHLHLPDEAQRSQEDKYLTDLYNRVEARRREEESSK